MKGTNSAEKRPGLSVRDIETIMRSLKVKLDFAEFKKNDSFEEIVTFLSENSGIPIQIDPKVRPMIARDLSEVTVRVDNLSLHSALNLLCTIKNLRYDVEPGGIKISPQFVERPKLELYTCSDLTMSHPAEAGWESDPEVPAARFPVFGVNFEELAVDRDRCPPYSEVDLIELIKENVAPDCWNDFPRVSASFSQGKLMISQTPSVHESIRGFLDRLRGLARRPLRMKGHLITFKSNFLKQHEVLFSSQIRDEAEGSHSLTVYSLLDPEQVDALLESAESSKDAAVLPLRDTTLFPGRWGAVCHYRQTQCLVGYEGDGDESSDCLIGRVFDGIVVRMRHLADPAGGTIHLRVEGQVASVTRPTPTIPLEHGEIAVPTQTTQRYSLGLDVAPDRSLLVAGIVNPFEEQGDRSFGPNPRKKENLMVLLTPSS